MESDIDWRFGDGSSSTESATLELRPDGTLALRLAAERIRSPKAASLAVMPSFGRAEKGEAESIGVCPHEMRLRSGLFAAAANFRI